MHLFNSALGRNITFVRPVYFAISGLTGIPNIKYYYIFIVFVYIVSVLGNTAVMALIILDHNLRTPKYVIIFNLALVDLICSTALVPKVLDMYFSDHYYISYNDCMTYFFFCYTCFTMQTVNLVVLSYDRLIAISFPLHYPIKVTHRFMFTLIASLWVLAITVTLTAAGLLTRLSFCKSVVINSYFCDHRQIFRLACNDNSPSYIISTILIVLCLWLPLFFIVCSYLYIGYALSKVATLQERVKAFKTCTAHLSVVAIYFLPVLVIFTSGTKIHLNSRILDMSLTNMLPAMLNPIIYVLQTQEIKESVKKLLKIRVQHKTVVKNV